MTQAHFEWDENKDAGNQKKHGVAFSLAQYAFADAHRVIAEDLMHTTSEKRYFCFGAVDGEILTVRFTSSHYTHLLPISLACVTLCQIFLKIEQIFPI